MFVFIFIIVFCLFNIEVDNDSEDCGVIVDFLVEFGVMVILVFGFFFDVGMIIV